MITIVLIIIGYTLPGLAWARIQSVRLQTAINDRRGEKQAIYDEAISKNGYVLSKYQRLMDAQELWFTQCTPRVSVKCECGCALTTALAYHVLGWPIFALGRLCVWLLSWSAQPVRIRQAEVAALRARADEGEQLLRDKDISLDPDDRKILLSVWTDYREAAKKLEL